MGKRFGLWAIGTVLVLAAGCSSTGPLSGVVEDNSDSTNAEPRDAPDALDSPDDREMEAPTEVLEPCPERPREQMTQTVTRQTEAFAVGDFELAYSFASPSFRASIDLERFTALISESYGPLTATTQLRFGDCLINVDGGYGTLDTRFDQDGASVFGLRYVLSETPEGWRVDGASDLQLIGGGA